MNKRTQKIEPIAIDELTAIANQLRDAADVMFDALATMKEKDVSELHVLYKSTFFRAVKGANRSRESTYDAWRSLQMGKTVEVSPRSVSKAAEKAAKVKVKRVISEHATKPKAPRKKPQ